MIMKCIDKNRNVTYKRVEEAGFHEYQERGMLCVDDSRHFSHQNFWQPHSMYRCRHPSSLATTSPRRSRWRLSAAKSTAATALISCNGGLSPPRRRMRAAAAE